MSERLGEGAFGVVMKGEVVGINGGKRPTTVAVKMLKGGGEGVKWVDEMGGRGRGGGKGVDEHWVWQRRSV